MAEMFDLLTDVHQPNMHWTIQDNQGGRIHASIPKRLIILVDEVVGIEDPRDLVTSLGKETKRMAINLQDIEKNTIRCILFGTCVDELTPLMAEERAEQLIVILQFFRVNRWDEKTSVQSHFDISKVCCDPALKEIRDFLNSMLILAQPAQSHYSDAVIEQWTEDRGTEAWPG
ncbi:hypothetical protein PIB30_007214 [Stylosanthes scabra]|uniref:Uncharacterized protein n=1 Tax=Stylosanthes scabra TaxID=79078 RepID=A0ABU6V3I8_9FABA|nr:hypothetical protein [Stylosanthes scabra]